VLATLPSSVLPYFIAIYTRDEDELTLEKLASRVLHGGQHRASSLKHRVGNEFIRRKLYLLRDYLRHSRAASCVT